MLHGQISRPTGQSAFFSGGGGPRGWLLKRTRRVARTLTLYAPIPDMVILKRDLKSRLTTNMISGLILNYIADYTAPST